MEDLVRFMWRGPRGAAIDGRADVGAYPYGTVQFGAVRDRGAGPRDGSATSRWTTGVTVCRAKVRADGGVMETARDSSVVRVGGAVEVERESAAGAVAITGARVRRRDGSQTVIAHGGRG